MIEQQQLKCVVFPDLFAWERQAISPMIAQLSRNYGVQEITLEPARHKQSPRRFPELFKGTHENQPLWVVAKDWRRAIKWSRGHRGPVFVSILSLERFGQVLPLLFLRNLKSTLPSNVHLVTHSPLSFRFFRELEGIDEKRVSFLPLSLTNGLDAPPGGPKTISDPVVFGTLARFSIENNLNFLLNVAHYVHRNRPDVQWRIFGAGPLESHLNRIVRDLGLEDSVRILKGAGIQDIQALDVLLYVPLRNEHFIPVLLAGAVGIPVLATEIPGIEDLVTDSREGFILPVNETKPMAELLLRLSGDAVLRRNLGANLKSRLSERLSAEKLSPDYERLFFNAAVETAAASAA